MWNGYTRDTERGEHYHPNQKPVALWDWVLKLKGVPTKGAILDPYCGSGSLLLAAKAMGRRCVGIELSKHYCQTVLARIKKERQKKKDVLSGFW